MKRIASLILCALVVLTSCVLFAIPAAAADKVVYVKDGGTGDGSTASSPLGTLDAAIAALSTNGGIVKLVGDTTLVANAASSNDAYPFGYFKAPSYKGQVTITSDDVINKAKLIWTDACQWFAVGGNTVIENVKMVNGLTSGQARVLALGNHLTMGEGLEMYFGDTLHDNSTITAGFNGFSIVGLTTAGCDMEGMLAADSWLTFKSGVYSSIFGKCHNYTTDSGELTGNAYMEFLGDFAVREMGSTSWGAATQIHDLGQAYVTFDAKVTAWRFFPGYNYVSKVPFTCNFFILGGAYVDANGAPLALVGAAKVQVLNIWSDDSNTEAYDLASQFSAYSSTQEGGATNIDDIKNYNGPAYRPTEDSFGGSETVDTTEAVVDTTEATVDTTAATVDTTEAAGQVTPPTGDASLMLVFVAAAIACVAAVVVIKKNER